MEIKINLTDTKNLKEIYIVSDEESAKFFFFSIREILKSLLSRIRNPIVANISPFLIDSQIKRFFYQLKAERKLEYPYNFKGKSGKIILLLRDEIKTDYKIIDEKKENEGG